MKKIIVCSLIILMSLSGCASLEESSKPQYYPCVIGCGNESFTPANGYYYDPKAPGKQRPLSELYEKNK
jgi:hypothetical protein